MTPLTIPAVLSDVLTACSAAFDDPDAPTAPTRRYVTHGPVVADGEMLVVALGGISPVHPFPLAQIRAIKSTVIPSALINIEVWRSCWPTAHVTSPAKALPSPTKIALAAAAAAHDASTIFAYVAQLAATGLLFPSLPTISTSEDVALGTMIPLGPTGGLAGWRWPISVKLAVPGPVA